jgi:hypothetical protein
MATFVQTKVKWWLDEFDISADFNAVTRNYGAETPDDTTYGDDTRSVAAGGLYTVRLEGEGYWQVAVDATLFARVGLADTVTAIGPVDGSEGSPAFFSLLTSGEYAPISGTVGDMAAFRVSGEGRGGAGLIKGQIFINRATISSSGNSGTAVQLGAVSATQAVYASLHALTVSGGTLDVTVESDDDVGMGSATTQITFTQVTAVGSEFASQAGAITDDWWRVDFTDGGGGTFDFVVCVGIK